MDEFSWIFKRQFLFRNRKTKAFEFLCVLRDFSFCFMECRVTCQIDSIFQVNNTSTRLRKKSWELFTMITMTVIYLAATADDCIAQYTWTNKIKFLRKMCIHNTTYFMVIIFKFTSFLNIKVNVNYSSGCIALKTTDLMKWMTHNSSQFLIISTLLFKL